MRVIAKRTLREFWSQQEYADAEQPLRAWYSEARQAEWKTPQDIKAQFRHASILKGNWVVFNIAGNKYRLMLNVNYAFGIVYIRFDGTRKQHDAIEAERL